MATAAGMQALTRGSSCCSSSGAGTGRQRWRARPQLRNAFAAADLGLRNINCRTPHQRTRPAAALAPAHDSAGAHDHSDVANSSVDDDGDVANSSIDCTDVIDWSDVVNDGWGPTRPRLPKYAPGSGKRGSVWNATGCGAPRLLALSSSWGSTRCQAAWLPRAPAAAPLRGLAAAALPAGAGQQQGTPAASQQQPPAGPAAGEDSDEDCHYEGGELPPLGQLGDPGALPDWPGTPSGSCRPQAAHSKQAQQARRRELGPAANIIGGRWQKPSRAEADRMMAMECGPDEGV